MHKFIKLTERLQNGKEQPVLLNTNFINSIKKAHGGDTHINMQDKHYFFVKESVLQIEQML